MDITKIDPALTGNALIEAMQNIKNKRRPIVDGLIYEHTLLLISADPGLGKSTVSTQVMVEIAAGLPVFGYFTVQEPTKVMYIQTERGIIELLERLEVISKSLPIHKDNIIISDEYQKLDIMDIRQAGVFIDSVKRDSDTAQVLFVDPIYNIGSGGIDKGKPATIFTKLMSIIQKETNMAIWYNHHTTKPMYASQTGEKIEKDDPYYGAVWLKAHVTGSYYMTATNDGVLLTCKKDNYHLLTKRIYLEYNPETGLCNLKDNELTPEDKFSAYLKARIIDRKEFTFKDIQQQTLVCTRTLRNLILHSTFKDSFSFVTGSKNKKLYKFTG